MIHKGSGLLSIIVFLFLCTKPGYDVYSIYIYIYINYYTYNAECILNCITLQKVQHCNTQSSTKLSLECAQPNQTRDLAYCLPNKVL